MNLRRSLCERVGGALRYPTCDLDERCEPDALLSNVDAVSQPAELRSAAAAGVAALYLEGKQLPNPGDGRSYVVATAPFDYQQHLCHAVTRYASDVWLAGSSPAVP